ncbi:hypothetical protein HDU76_002219 [Blyttiomyces sp. JEL0837]|nr:hypothetical protein HDU76_002219 [Blyttiomyces sp. JEL0837]
MSSIASERSLQELENAKAKARDITMLSDPLPPYSKYVFIPADSLSRKLTNANIQVPYRVGYESEYLSYLKGLAGGEIGYEVVPKWMVTSITKKKVLMNGKEEEEDVVEGRWMDARERNAVSGFAFSPDHLKELRNRNFNENSVHDVHSLFEVKGRVNIGALVYLMHFVFKGMVFPAPVDIDYKLQCIWKLIKTQHSRCCTLDSNGTVTMQCTPEAENDAEEMLRLERQLADYANEIEIDEEFGVNAGMEDVEVDQDGGNPVEQSSLNRVESLEKPLVEIVQSSLSQQNSINEKPATTSTVQPIASSSSSSTSPPRRSSESNQQPQTIASSSYSSSPARRPSQSAQQPQTSSPTRPSELIQSSQTSPQTRQPSESSQVRQTSSPMRRSSESTQQPQTSSPMRRPSESIQSRQTSSPMQQPSESTQVPQISSPTRRPSESSQQPTAKKPKMKPVIMKAAQPLKNDPELMQALEDAFLWDFSPIQTLGLISSMPKGMAGSGYGNGGR